MTSMIERTMVGTWFKCVKWLLLCLITLTTLTATVTADCDREIIWIGDRIYGGRMYSDFVSCGSSSGNFAYTCAKEVDVT